MKKPAKKKGVVTMSKTTRAQYQVQKILMRLAPEDRLRAITNAIFGCLIEPLTDDDTFGSSYFLKRRFGSLNGLLEESLPELKDAADIKEAKRKGMIK